MVSDAQIYMFILQSIGICIYTHLHVLFLLNVMSSRGIQFGNTAILG